MTVSRSYGLLKQVRKKVSAGSFILNPYVKRSLSILVYNLNIDSMNNHPIRGIVSPIALVATIFVGLITVLGFLIVPVISEPLGDMYVEPAGKTISVGQIFSVRLMVKSLVPTNVFAGELLFDNDILAVDSIDYNTSIADIWAKKPWYSNGAGTINFIGGTTHKDGFLGTDALMTITFKAVGAGDGTLSINDPRILRYDGKGTDLTLPDPIDTVVTVQQEEQQFSNTVTKEHVSTPINVVKTPPSTDLNGDGKQSILDISIFILHLGSNDPRYDFNLDGKVNTDDLSILLNAK
jgi:hypothetical protein